MNSFLRNTISKLYNAVSAPVAATRDALAERLQSVRETASLLYNRMMENMGYGQERLKDIVEKEAEEQKPAATKEEEEEAKEQQQEPAAAKEQQQDDDDERYDTVTKIKLVRGGKRVKEFRVTRNLNRSNTKMIMDNITPHIEMRVKVIYSFKSVIQQGGGEIKDYSKTLDSPSGMFTSLKEIQAYIEECEQKRLNLDNEELWSKAYLPTTRTTEVRCNYEGKVIFKHDQIRLVASNEPLMGCGPLADWLRKKRCIYAMDTFDDNLCVWRYLVICRLSHGEKCQVQKRNCDAPLDLVCEYYGDNKLKKRDVRPTRLVDFEDIAKHHNVNIMLYEPKKNARSIWWSVYGKIQHNSDLSTINMGLLGGHCFYFKKIDVLCGRWECKGCRQIFTRNKDFIRHRKYERCAGGKRKSICPGGKFKHILNSSEKVFHGGDTKFSYAVCRWIETQAIETGKHIHHKMCGDGGERMVTVGISNAKGEKEPRSFLVDGHELETNTVYQFHGCH